MRGISRILMALGVVAVVAALAMPTALAQCPTSREFGALGNGRITGRIKIDTATNGFPNDGNELSSVYDAAGGCNNAGDHFGGPNTSCPSSTWYMTGGMFLMGDSGIQGFIGSASCQLNCCPGPGAQLTVLLEDENGGDAGFICYDTVETPSAIRWYAHEFTGPVPAPIGGFRTDVFESYPKPFVTSSLCQPPNTQIVSNYADLGLNAHASAGGAPTGPEKCIQSYDIVWHHGPSDPGRSRADWALLESIPYTGGPVVGNAQTVPCPTLEDDTFVAIGATFKGGVQSLLVGAPIMIECDWVLAEPEVPKIDRKKRRSRLAPHGRGR